MHKWIVAAGIIAISLSACNTQNVAMENQTSPERTTLTMADVIPVKAPSTLEAREQQENFLEENENRFKSRQLAAAYYVAQAKRTFNEENLDSASYLFGRAWLMDSTNNDIYWGYGLVYGQQKEYDKALFILYRALESDKENSRLLTDIATSHLGRFYELSDLEDLLQSKKLLEEAVKVEPDNAEASYKLAVNCYYLREFQQARAYLHQSIQQDKNVADETFISALLEKQNDPEGLYVQ
ncbi:tetratricopeptide repeat protein [Pontibacter silvestris]|uniref:Tetratricopeptide repeat protein n=1 Tax=Pontibacter silvestris TaxID=2305183 RepID=A0ABW4WWA8_9BACT|nr:hypothetical protein [Pontibacter silvestris]MCC9137432.1 hypothetical protein [Pontibacter silvestris]